MTPLENLELQLKWLALASAILDWRGASTTGLEKYRVEIVRVRAWLAEAQSAEGGGAHSVAV